MKLYRDAPQASIRMSDDPALVAAIDAAIRTYGTRVAIETGTFEGTGSTRIIAESLRRSGDPITFVTMEVSFDNWYIAYQNLRQFLFVDCRWGCSVDRAEAIEHVRKDAAIIDHHKYPDIYIDDIDDPIRFYSNELNGALGSSAGVVQLVRQAKNWLRSKAGSGPRYQPGVIARRHLMAHLWSGESLLPQFLRLHRESRPLVVLDSAGGCGLYEFQLTMDIMRDARFLLLLDDTHHLKHFRSLRQVKANSHFKLLGESEYHGWALAWHE
jgi:hypothetical protein